ncbi:MAG: histidine ammonia-lyase [Actinobacteria bacterium]|nr:histidine ammonia-lyase [Actinomycetota bacterium]
MSVTRIVLDGGALTRAEVVAVARGEAEVAIGEHARGSIAAAAALIARVAGEGQAVYGVTTGFGSLESVRIPDDQLSELQVNIVRSHAVGVGEPLPVEVVRGMLVLLAASLSRGHSGVRVDIVEALVELLNAGITPVVPSRGSVGASGDLAPLAHLALVLIGEGEALTPAGERVDGATALRLVGVEPIALGPKEGLALLNGTHLMAAIGALALTEAEHLFDAAQVAAAMSVDALLGSSAPFDPRLHVLRNRPQQQAVAARLLELIDGSEMRESHVDCERVQDAYTLRCIPQVLGAIGEALDYIDRAIEPEFGAVTDNPLLFVDDGDVLSGGNFHGQPLSLPLDMLTIAVQELAAFSERRIFRLMDGRSGDPHALPPFLIADPGTKSGLMIAQYMAASLVAEGAVLSHPAGVGSLPTSAGQEDFNSMGATAGLQALQVLALARRVVAVELIAAAQGFDLRRPLLSGPKLEAEYAKVRELSPPLVEDRSQSAEFEAVAEAIRVGVFG